MRWASIVALVTLAGCAPPLKRATMSELQARSSFDLSCPGHQLLLYSFAAGSKGVVGCGGRAVYVERCDPASGVCAWRQDMLPAPPTPQPVSTTVYKVTTRPAPPPPRRPAPRPPATPDFPGKDRGF